MKAFVPLVVLSVLPILVAQREVPSPAGVYRSAGGTQVITLALLPNGAYLARWDLDISPEHGRATGTWRLEGDEVRLTPKKEEGGLKGHLTVFLVREIEGKRALLRKEDAQHADNPFFYFYKKEELNNSPEATPGQRPPAAPSPSSGAPQL